MKFNRQQFLDDLRLLATMNVPWRHQGRSPETGMDCVFAPRYCFEKQMKMPEKLAQEFEQYNRPPDGQKFLSILRKFFIEIEREEVQPADCMVIYQRRNPCHLVVQMEDNQVAEAYESMDRSVSRFLIRPLDPRCRIAACFRIPDEI